MAKGVRAYFVEGAVKFGSTVSVWNAAVAGSTHHAVDIGGDGTLRCDCLGFVNRRKCVHCDTVQAKLTPRSTSPGWHG